MTLLVALWLAFASPPSAREVAAFRATAPEYLTLEQALGHMIAARAAAVVYGVPETRLLSIAHHESRYRVGTRTAEPGGRVSCGVMTPIPKRRCSAAELTLVGGYAAGAAHLAMWARYYPGRASLLAYAGGGGLVRVCRRGPWPVAGRDVCRVADAFLARERMIRRALASARTSAE